MTDAQRRIRAAAITGVGQMLGLLGSVMIGVLVAGTLPPSPRVDGFFAANQVYALALYLGQAVRITAPALLLRAGLSTPRLQRAVGSLTSITVAAGLIAALFGSALVAPSARDAFTTDLLLLTPAAAIHVLSGGLAARLAVAGSFSYAAGAYASGSVVAGVLLLLTIGDQGASAVAPALLAGAVSVGLVMLLGRHRVLRAAPADPFEGAHAATGPEPVAAGASASPLAPSATVAPEAATVPVSPSIAATATSTSATTATAAAPMTARAGLSRIALGAVPPLSQQLLVAVVTVAAGHVVTGGTALLSYAFLALFACTTLAITPMSIVLGPDLARRWDGTAESLALTIRRATSLAVVVAVPIVAAAFLAGRPLADALLSAALSPADLDVVFQSLAILVPSLLVTAAAAAATVGITAGDRLNTLASGLAGVGVIVIATGVVAALADWPLLLIAGAASALTIAFSVVTIIVAIGRLTARVLAQLLLDALPLAVPAAAATVVLLELADGRLLAGLLAAAAVAALHAVLATLMRGESVVLLTGVLRPARSS